MSNNPLRKQSQGLGDTVEKVAYIATLGRITSSGRVNRKKKGDDDCGCNKRKKALNKKSSYNKEG